MAKLMLIGEVADVEFTFDPDYGTPIAMCVRHTEAPDCTWTEVYDTLDDASAYAADHADTGRE